MIDLRVGDALTILRTLGDQSVHCCVTSPPYWGLRDYGIEGQLGLERTPEEYVASMVEVFREVRRVLKDDGTLWLNLGDSYATGAGKVGDCPGGGDQGERWKTYGPARAQVPDQKNPDAIVLTYQPNRMPLPGLKPKDLVGIPWRVAFALQADGWYLRCDIIWHKPNPMPESVTDRPTKAHEYVFLLSKSERYWYDADAIKELASESILSRWSQDVENQEGSHRANGGRKTNGTMKAVGGPRHSDKQRGHSRRHAGFNDRWDAMSHEEQCSGKRNKRSVWTISTKPYRESHFATFPPELPRICIRAGCPKGGTVLDPFAGSGTVGMVAEEEGCNALLIELNPKYAKLIQRRTRQAGLFVPA